MRTQRHLVVFFLVATLLTACGGGGGGTATHPVLTPQAVSVKLDMGEFATSIKRNPKFVGANIDQVTFDFHPSSGSDTTGTFAFPSGCPSDTCTLLVAPGTYTLTISLDALISSTQTAIGSGTATGVSVVAGASNSVIVTISPVLSGPNITVSPTHFFVDGQNNQTATATVEELDPAGNIIYGSASIVPNWSTLTLSDDSTSTITLSPMSIASPPATASGNTVTITYNGQFPGEQNLHVTVADGSSNHAQVTIPFVSLSASPSTVTIIGLGISNGVFTAVTEANNVDTSAFAENNTCGIHASVLQQPFSGGVQTFEVVGVDTGITSCAMTIASSTDSHLTVTIPIEFSIENIGIR